MRTEATLRALRRATLVAGLVGLVSVSALRAQDSDPVDAASTGETAQFLLLPIGARNVGLGGAFAGSRGDVEGALWHPASLASIERWAVHYHGSNDFGTSSHALGGVVPVGSHRLGVSLLSLDLGTIDGRDGDNQPIGTIDLGNTLAVLTFATRISGSIEAGASYKYVRLGASCASCGDVVADRSGHAFDASALVELDEERRYTVGVVLSNIGPGISRDGGSSDPLPARLRVGGAALVLNATETRPVTIVARLDLRETFSEFDDLDAFGGAEVAYADLAFLRVGYAAAASGRSGPSIGVGLRYEGFQLDLGRSFDDFAGFDSDSPFLVSVGYQP